MTWAWHGLVLLCCFMPSALAASGPWMPLGEGVWGHPSTPLRCIPSSEREEESSWDSRSLRQRCLQALAAVSTHPSIVRETVPVLLQHFRKVQKGNTAHSRQLHGVFLCRSCRCYQGWL